MGGEGWNAGFAVRGVSTFSTAKIVKTHVATSPRIASLVQAREEAGEGAQ